MPGTVSFPRRFLRPHVPLCAAVLTCVVIEACYYAGVPFTFRYIVDDGLVGGNHGLLLTLIGGLVGCAVIAALIGLLRDFLFARLSATVMSEVREAMFDHLQRQSVGFFAANATGDLMARFTTDLASIERTSVTLIAWSILPALDVAGSTALLFVLNWKLALVSLLVWPLTVAGPTYFARRLARESEAKNEDEGRLLGFLQENLNAQMVIKTFGLEGFARRIHGEHLGGWRQRLVRVALLSSRVERSAYVGVMLLQVTLLGVGAYMVSQGMMTVGALAGFQTLFLSLSYSLASVTQYIPTLVQARAGMRGIEKLLSEEPRVVDRGTQVVSREFGEIRFQDVSFGYDDTRRNLDGLTVTLPRGSFTGVVGGSGSGKSTILTLLMRLYDVNGGSVTIDGRDIRAFSLHEYRSLFGYVPQESFLFDFSIRENIRLGRPGASDAEVEEAARLAEVDEAVRQLPEGYETAAGERGGRLSGGQRQRVALARALLREPAVLILDEATSALDPVTEAAIHGTLERLRAGRTIVSVTHRLSTVASADQILVMENGRLRERGSHEELLRLAGPYQQLWTKQHGFLLNAMRHEAEISVDRLRLVPAFYGMPDGLLEEAARLLQTEEFPAEHMVYQEGEFGTSLYIIVRGSVQLTGAHTVLLEDGDSFGESALLEGVAQTENARTLTPSVFLTLNRAGFAYLAGKRDALTIA